jgi:hypothetical protein
MDFLYHLFVVLHFVGWAMVFGGYLATLRGKALARVAFDGAMTVLVSGIVMMGLIESGTAGPSGFPREKLIVKLGVALVVAILAVVARRQGKKADNGTGPVTPAVKHAIGALTAANILIAVFW